MKRLFIHDKCMEQMFELPKVVQKKVLEFQKKFRENSKSAAIHLEPISTFKDPLLRTARIDDKYRAIVKVPDSGEDYYLLWVDNHDEAMDWARNKVFQWNQNTQTAQIFTAPELHSIADSAHPKATEVRLFDDYSDEQLLQIGVPEQSLKLVRSIKDLNEFGDAEKYLPNDAYENLFYLTDGRNYELLVAEINEGKIESNKQEDQLSSLNNKRSFIEVSDELISEIINGDLSKWQIFLHPAQRKLVESHFKGPVKVTGGAGTGKTVVALHRLKYLAISDNVDSRKVLFTTFTSALTSNLIRLAEKLSIDSSRVVIANLDSLVKDFALQFGLIDKGVRILDLFNAKSSIESWESFLEQNLSEFDSSFLSLEYQSVILFNNITTEEGYFKVSRLGRGKPITRKQRIDIWQLIGEYNQYKKAENYIDRSQLFNIVTDHFNGQSVRPFRNVIADEVQDFSNVELRLLRSLVDEKDNDLFLVGDPFQKIYARKTNFTSAGINIRGNRSRTLRINYRTSEEIKRLAISAVQGAKYDDFDGESEKLSGYLSLFHGEVPTYEMFKTKTDEIEAILSYVKWLRESGLKYNDIAIACRLKESIKELKNTLHKTKIPYYDNSNSSSTEADGIVLSTLHNLKGLEFKAVILSDLNNRTAPLYFQKYNQLEPAEKEGYTQSEKSLLYVAITRAIKFLKIFGTGVPSDYIKL
jgi:hypothetical protein